jgi:hypothetical protein
MRLLLSSNNNLGHNAIGVDYAGNNNTWFSIPSGMSFKFFDGNDTIFSISRTAINYNGSGLVYGAGGTTNYLSKFTGSSRIGNSIIYDDGTNIGIGTTSPSTKLEVVATGTTSVDIAHFSNSNGVEKAKFALSSGGDGTLALIDGSNNSNIFLSSNASTNSYINCGNVGIGTTNPGYKLQVSGSFGATTKSFRIDHPSKPGYSLEYGSLESPYHGVRLTGRGKLVKGVGAVMLPNYLKDLIHDDDNLNIQITNIKHGKIIYIDKIDLKNDRFSVKADRAKSLGELHFFWTLTGVRKDVEGLVVEKEN